MFISSDFWTGGGTPGGEGPTFFVDVRSRNGYSFLRRDDARPASSSPRAGSGQADAILDAALDLFVERGYYGTAVPLVAERAGVGAGTIYRYFKSKEDLVNTLYRQVKQSLANFVHMGVKQDVPAREVFRQLWFRLAEFAQKYPKGFAFLELHHHGSYLDDESRAIEARILDLTRAFIMRLQVEQGRQADRADDTHDHRLLVVHRPHPLRAGGPHRNHR